MSFFYKFICWRDKYSHLKHLHKLVYGMFSWNKTLFRSSVMVLNRTSEWWIITTLKLAMNLAAQMPIILLEAFRWLTAKDFPGNCWWENFIQTSSKWRVGSPYFYFCSVFPWSLRLRSCMMIWSAAHKDQFLAIHHIIIYLFIFSFGKKYLACFFWILSHQHN